MRVTNKMLTSNMLNNISRNKENMSILGDQYSTWQKIQRPSQDPVVAVRSLKFSTDIAELTQYLKKNIPDARGWMDVTENAYNKEINPLLTEMLGYCSQGSTDEWLSEDRSTIIANLKEYTAHIYSAGNSDYAGRYVFTGYRTDVPLLFKTDSNKTEYDITEPLSSKNLEQITWITGGAEYDETKTQADYAEMAPKPEYAYRLRLSYDQLADVQGVEYVSQGVKYDDPANPGTELTGEVKTIFEDNGAGELTAHTYAKDADGNFTVAVTTNPPASGKINVVSSNDPDAYKADGDSINFIKETGELIIGNNKYDEMRKATDIKANYSKTSFKKDELRPEHYFDCKTYALKADGTRDMDTEKVYTRPENQVIEYEINFSQKLQVNNMANESITHELGRDINEILNQIEKVQALQRQRDEVDKMLKDENIQNDEEKKASLQELRDQLSTEITLESKIMQQKFNKGMTTVQNMQDAINTSLADLGSRYARLNLTEARLENQSVDFAEMQKDNDQVNLEDALINFESAKVVYNSSLSAASKVVQNSLLDFL